MMYRCTANRWRHTAQALTMDSTSLQWPPSPFMTAAMTRVFMFHSRSD